MRFENSFALRPLAQVGRVGQVKIVLSIWSDFSIGNFGGLSKNLKSSLTTLESTNAKAIELYKL